jgi:hypothetical protein
LKVNGYVVKNVSPPRQRASHGTVNPAMPAFASPVRYDMPPILSRTDVHDMTAGGASKRLPKWSKSSVAHTWRAKKESYETKNSWIWSGIDRDAMLSQSQEGFKMESALPLSTHNGNPVRTKRGNASEKVTPVWCNSAEYRRRWHKFELQFREARRAYKQADLRRIITIRRQQAEDKAFEQSWRKWNAAHALHDRILELPKPYNKVRVDRLSETFYNTAPTPVLARPRFMMSMRKCFNFEIANIDSISEPKDLRVLENVLVNFDRSGADTIDTRELISALRFYTHSRHPTRQLLEWCFVVFASEGTIQWTKKTGAFGLKRLSMPTVSILFENMADDMGTRRNMKELLRKGWKALPEEHHGEAITFKAFKHMLDHPPFREVLTDHKPPEDFLCSFEHLYSFVLRDWLQSERFNAYRDRQLRKFLTKWRNLRIVKSMESWVDFTRRRQSARRIVQHAADNWRLNNFVKGFTQYRRNVLWMLNAESIQRVYRGFVGRERARWEVQREWAASTLQRIYRGRAAFFSFLATMRRRDAAARNIQRVYRGHLGRRRTHKVLLEFYRIKRAQIMKEKREWRAEVRRRAATKIEALGRGWIGRRIGRQKRQERDDKQAGEDAMADWKREMKRQHLLYCQKMETLYKKNKAEREYEKEQAEAEKRVARTIFMNQLKRWMVNRNEERAQEQAEREEEEREVWETFEAKWMDLQDKKEDFIRQLVNKETEERNKNLNEQERANKVAGKKRARELVNVVRKERREMGMRSSMSELKAVAFKRYVRERQDEAIKEMNVRKEEERKAKQKELVENWDAGHIELFRLEEDQKLRLVKTLQRMWRSKVAWRPMRKEVDTLYSVEFDPATQNVYYVNNKLGTVQWDAPKLLYGRKLPKPDEWYICKDENDIPFYFHPRRDEMQYKTPYDYTGPNAEYNYPGNES